MSITDRQDSSGVCGTPIRGDLFAVHAFSCHGPCETHSISGCTQGIFGSSELELMFSTTVTDSEFVINIDRGYDVIVSSGAKTYPNAPDGSS